MKHPSINLTLILIILSSAALSAAEDLSGRIESALSQAGDNAPQLRKALAEVPDSQAEGMRFLIAYMPQRDLKSLSADFLLENVDFAYQAWHEAPWKDQIPREVFLNDVLPYARINEGRDNWRRDFFPFITICQWAPKSHHLTAHSRAAAGPSDMELRRSPIRAQKEKIKLEF